MIEANNPKLTSFIDIPKGHDFPIQNLPFGIFSDQKNTKKRVGVAIGNFILDLEKVSELKLIDDQCIPQSYFSDRYLNNLMSLPRKKITDLRNSISQLLREGSNLKKLTEIQTKVLIPKENASLHLPVKIGGYTDFYSSIEHATNIGKLFRDKDNPLLPNWKHIPVGYDGRASSIVVSGTNFRRPLGQIKPDPEQPPVYAPCRGLDVEVEMGYFIGNSSNHGEQISTKKAPEHIFGMVLVNDWSARDIQKWEYVPLGPFLAKNFCTSISPWVVTLDALEPFYTKAPDQDVDILPYLKRSGNHAVDVNLELSIQTQGSKTAETIAKMNFKSMYWDFTQQLAHHTVNGCPMKTGDLLASGTISGDHPKSYGSFIELTFGGKEAIKLTNDQERVFLKDGDTAIIRGFCQNEDYRIGFGEVKGTVLPALEIKTETNQTKEQEMA